MRRNGRKEVTMIRFKGIAADGGFVFEASVFHLIKGIATDCIFYSNIGNNRTKTVFKAVAYADGVMEIAIDCKESIPRVSELVSGMFSRKSRFTNLDSVILNYRNIRLQIGRSTGKKDIICMLMKAMSSSDYKDGDNEVSVDTKTCQKRNPLRDSDKLNMLHEGYTNSFCFDEIFKCGKSLWFRNFNTLEAIIISSIKDGVVKVKSAKCISISEFVAELRKFFVPYSNFYGIKAIEVEFNGFSIRVNEHNSDRILYLYRRYCYMFSGLLRREFFQKLMQILPLVDR